MNVRQPIVLGIAGSPRRHGNSDRLLDAALAGARETGALTATLIASDAGLKPCLGCGACSLTGDCIQFDRGPTVYEAIESADAIIVASPVYFASVPAGMKALYDRMQPYWARTHVLMQPRPPRRPGAILLARGGGDPYGFEGAEATTRSVLAVLGVDVLGVLHATDVDAPGELEHHPGLSADARALGAAVAAEALLRIGAA
ncbi:MAG: flavodoxin family protein [Actinobacteria bacterium]|nr:flavodoxin family protein [Actinomycetota bacterium]